MKSKRLSEDQVEKYLTKYIKDHEWSAAEANRRIRSCAASRWSTLDRWTAAKAPVKAVKPAVKAVKPAVKAVKPKVKKAAKHDILAALLPLPEVA